MEDLKKSDRLCDIPEVSNGEWSMAAESRRGDNTERWARYNKANEASLNLTKPVPTGFTIPKVTVKDRLDQCMAALGVAGPSHTGPRSGGHRAFESEE